MKHISIVVISFVSTLAIAFVSVLIGIAIQKNIFEYQDQEQRILLTSKNVNTYISQELGNCFQTYNLDAATMYVPYNNPAQGASFAVPYNEKWGNERFKIMPFEEQNGLLSFGPIDNFEGCGPARAHFLKIESGISAVDAVEKIENETAGEYSKRPVVEEKNNFKTIRYVSKGLCDTAHVVVVGFANNYDFYNLCSDDFETLDAIVDTLQIQPSLSCGNGIVESGEDCDPNPWNGGVLLPEGTSCQLVGVAGGTLRCGPNCKYDLSECYVGF